MVQRINDERILRLIKRDSNAGMNLLIETYGGLVACIVRRKISPDETSSPIVFMP